MIIEKTKDYSEIKKTMLELKQSFYSKEVANDSSIEILAKKFCENAEFFIAKQDGKITGFISFYCNDYFSKTAFISMIIVDEKCQGKGLGKALIKHAIDYCRTQKMKYLKLEVACSNKNAISFYEKLGFIKSEQKNDSYFYELNF